MKPLKQVAQAYMALGEGERKRKEGVFGEAVEDYRRAMEVTRTIPAEEVFDHDGFDALCHAGLSSAFVELGRYEDGFASAELALKYFNRRGELHEAEGLHWIDAVVSRATALASTGKQTEALESFRIAGEMVDERKGEMPGRDALREKIESNIAILRTSMPEDRSKRKAWWEFWS